MYNEKKKGFNLLHNILIKDYHYSLNSTVKGFHVRINFAP